MKNLLATFGGKGISFLCSLIFTPLLIQRLGIESYGLISFSFTIITIICMMDLGLSAVVVREVSKRIALKESQKKILNFLRTFEVFYLAGSLFFTLVFLLFSDQISKYWLTSTSIDSNEVNTCLKLLAISIFFLWLNPFYSGLAIATNKHVTLNTVIIIFTVIKNVGVFLSYKYFDLPLNFYFLVHGISNFLQIGFLCFIVTKKFKYLKESFKLSWGHFKELKNYLGGVASITITSLLLTQIDRLLVSKISDLSDYGFYSLAANVSSYLNIIAACFFQAFFTQFTQLISLNKQNELKVKYHACSQTLSFFVIPIGLFLSFNSSEMLYLWTNNEVTSSESGYYLSILILGNTLNSLVTIPYLLQITSGKIKMTLMYNIISITIYVLLILIIGKYFGLKGVAYSWFLLNIGYVIIYVKLCHQKILKDELKTWYKNILIPLLVLLPYFFLAKKLDNFIVKEIQLFLILGVGFLLIAFINNPLKLKKELVFND